MPDYAFGSFMPSVSDAPWGRFFATLDLTATYPEPGTAEVAWPDPTPYSFPGPNGACLVHGGMLTTLADTAMGHATFTLMDAGQSFLTGDLRVDFLRAAPVGELLSVGRVERRARRVYHCSAQVLNPDRSTVYAEARCVQVMLG